MSRKLKLVFRQPTLLPNLCVPFVKNVALEAAAAVKEPEEASSEQPPEHRTPPPSQRSH